MLYNNNATVIGYATSVTKDTANVNPTTIIPEKVNQYYNKLGKELVDKLLDHKPHNHVIDLKVGEQPLCGLIYTLNETELQVLWEYLKEILELGKIHPSKSPATVPITFIPKAHGQGLRVYIDYYSLNKVTIAN
jgi:hypothetical protein